MVLFKSKSNYPSFAQNLNDVLKLVLNLFKDKKIIVTMCLLFTLGSIETIEFKI